MASQLFSPFKLRGIEFKNRIFMPPMDMFCGEGGFPSDWHFVHYGTRAMGGAALLIQEATAVSPEGRISPGCLGCTSSNGFGQMGSKTKRGFRNPYKPFLPFQQVSRYDFASFVKASFSV